MPFNFHKKTKSMKLITHDEKKPFSDNQVDITVVGEKKTPNSFLSLFSSKPKIEYTIEATLEKKMACDFENKEKFAGKIIAHIDVGYGNGLYIAGPAGPFWGWQKADRMECINANTWVINIGGHNGLEFKFFIGPYSLGLAPPTSDLPLETNNPQTLSNKPFNLSLNDFRNKANILSYNSYR